MAVKAVFSAVRIVTPEGGGEELKLKQSADFPAPLWTPPTPSRTLSYALLSEQRWDCMTDGGGFEVWLPRRRGNRMADGAGAVGTSSGGRWMPANAHGRPSLINTLSPRYQGKTLSSRVICASVTQTRLRARRAFLRNVPGGLVCGGSTRPRTSLRCGRRRRGHRPKHPWPPARMYAARFPGHEKRPLSRASTEQP